MAVPTNKDELLKAINTNFDKLIIDLRGRPAVSGRRMQLGGPCQGNADERCKSGRLSGRME